MLTVTIDCREASLILACKKIVTENVVIETGQLPLGDIIFSVSEPSMEQPKLKGILIIERKTISDLIASIRDGRYEEQGYRLSNSDEFPPHNVMYLIEGEPKPGDRRTVISAMTSIQVFKGFSIQRTRSVSDSAELIVGMADKIARKIHEGCKPYTHLTRSEPEEYCTVVKKVKKNNITSQSIGSIMLCQIPGISSTIATAIMNSPVVNRSFSELLRLLALPDVSVIENIVITSGSETKKNRKVGKSIVHKMQELLITNKTDTELEQPAPESESNSTKTTSTLKKVPNPKSKPKNVVPSNQTSNQTN